VARAFPPIWFTPRIELLPFSGDGFPLEAWRDDHRSIRHRGVFLLNFLYVALAAWGAWRLWRENSGVPAESRTALGFMLLQDGTLTTLETPSLAASLSTSRLFSRVGRTGHGKGHQVRLGKRLYWELPIIFLQQALDES
jgi:hypothetical protein